MKAKQGIKKDRQGNTLLTDYTADEMAHMGSRTQRCKDAYQ